MAKKRIKSSGVLTLLLVIAIVAVSAALGFNIYKVATTDSGSGDTMDTGTVDNKYSNDQYSIGNNPTDINKEYFLELNDALKDKTITGPNDTEISGSEAIAQSVVKNFICQYYTWTNKDGNYDIGGMQYIYTPKQSDFESYTLYNFYKDMDKYITQEGTSKLIEVSEVTINSVQSVDQYTVDTTEETTDEDGNTTTVTASLDCIDVDASWTYASGTSMDTSSIQNSATFHVVNNNGRWEIGGIE